MDNINVKKRRPVINLLIISIFTVIVFGLLILLMLTGIINEYIGMLMILAVIYAVVSLGLNLISGFTGQLALGHAGFMAVGAYTTAILLTKVFPAGVPAMALSILIGGVFAAAAGFLIGLPVLRLKGDYLAIVTLAFCIVIRAIIENLEKLTGGAAGLQGIPHFSSSYIVKFIWVFIFLIFTIVVISNLIKSSHGRALVSVRENEVAANAMGVNVSYNKVFAFVVSAAFAGIAGGLYAIYLGSIYPKNFDWMKSIDYVVVVVLGGMGSITGTLIGSVIVVFLQQLPDLTGASFLVDWRMVIYSLLLILLMRFRPKGIMGRSEFSVVNSCDKILRLLKKLFKLIGCAFKKLFSRKKGKTGGGEKS